MPDRGSTYNHIPLPVTSGGLTLLISFQRCWNRTLTLTLTLTNLPDGRYRFRYRHRWFCNTKVRNRDPRLFWIWYATEGKIKLPLFFLTKTLTMTKTCKDYIGISLKTLYISIHFGTTLYPKKYMHAPRAVHACTFFIVNCQLASLSFGCARWAISKQAYIALACTNLVNLRRQRLTTVRQDTQISASPDSGWSGVSHACSPCAAALRADRR